MSRTRKYVSTIGGDATSVQLRFLTSASSMGWKAGWPWTHPPVEEGLPSSTPCRYAIESVSAQSVDVVLFATTEIFSGEG